MAYFKRAFGAYLGWITAKATVIIAALIVLLLINLLWGQS